MVQLVALVGLALAAALQAQAVAARTYIQRNLGQYRNEGYDVCATDSCQVYLGANTEDPLASQAIAATRAALMRSNAAAAAPVSRWPGAILSGQSTDVGRKPLA